MENKNFIKNDDDSFTLKKRNFLPVIAGLFVGILVLSNILATKMIQLGPFIFDGGTLLFPLSYIFGDVLVEVYGYKTSRRIIWTGLVMLVIMSLNIWLIGVLPAQAEWPFQADFNNILFPMPRIALASIVGYFFGEYSNAVVLSKLKVKTEGKYLWMRTIGSTIIGELVDSILFVAIAFLGTSSIKVLIIMALSNYLFKTVIEVAFTPLTYKIVSYVKKHDGVDVYDYDETYSPLLKI